MFTSDSNQSLAHKLERLLAQPLEAVYEREAHLFDELAGSLANSLVLFGAGGLGRKTLKGLRLHGIEPLALTDNNPKLHGKQIDGLAVLAPAQAAHEYGRSALFLITIYTDSAPGGIEPIIQKLNEMGCERVLSFYSLYWKYAAQFLPHYAYDLPHKVIESSSQILAAFDLFYDPTSREEYFAQINWRLDPMYAQVPPQATHEIYFPPELITLNENEVFIDCGAYDGDTVQSFLKQTRNRFSRLLAFEPDPMNYQKLTELINSLPSAISTRLRTSNRAIGREPKLLHFNAQGVASSSFNDEGEIIVQSEPLDSLIRGETPTFIKMDIEGAELDALCGAEEQIRKHLPILAISAYHSQDHVWRLPLLIETFSENYRFFLRRYTQRFLDDLVLYAIPSHRMPHQPKSS
jgi:FkbM family methyltransferase